MPTLWQIVETHGWVLKCPAGGEHESVHPDLVWTSFDSQHYRVEEHICRKCGSGYFLRVQVRPSPSSENSEGEKVPEYKKTILVDFDGVLHSYKSGWQGHHIVADGPVPGAIAWLERLAQQFDVVIYSSRSRDPRGVRAMYEALERWAAAEGKNEAAVRAFMLPLTFPQNKPPAFLTIDDRCICFQGTFPSVEEINAFVPWHKK